MRKRTIVLSFGGVFALSLLFAGCMLDERPTTVQPGQYGPAQVEVRVQAPPPPASVVVSSRCGPGYYFRPGRVYWNGQQWVRLRGQCLLVPRAYRRPSCFFKRSRWVRTHWGWQLRRGRWICR